MLLRYIFDNAANRGDDKMPCNRNKHEIGISIMLGTGCVANYKNKQLDGLKLRNGKEISLFRAMCDAEYLSIIENNDTFIEYDWAMEKKWFANSLDDVNKWGNLFYPDGIYKIKEDKFDMKKIVEAQINWIQPEKGGRKNILPVGMRYCPIIVFESEKSDKTLWSAEIYNTEIKERTSIADLSYLADDAPYHLLQAKNKFSLYEGQSIIAKGIIK
jgi:hypothetical protein